MIIHTRLLVVRSVDWTYFRSKGLVGARIKAFRCDARDCSVELLSIALLMLDILEGDEGDATNPTNVRGK